MADLVPNPLHEALANALRTVEPLIRDIEATIEPPYQQFHSGRVWSGPVAQRFDAQLAHHRTRVRNAGERILADLRQALTRTPAEVPADEARVIATKYGLT